MLGFLMTCFAADSDLAGEYPQTVTNFRKSFDLCWKHARTSEQKTKCTNKEFIYQEKTLNTNYKKYYNTLSNKDKIELRDGQKRWIAKTDSICKPENVDDIAYCKLSWTALRSQYLESAFLLGWKIN
jgi:uncharacterized protein YecT (DUF1311 family)